MTHKKADPWRERAAYGSGEHVPEHQVEALDDRLVGDRALLDGFRRGDPSALREIYLVYAPKVTAFLRIGFAFNSQRRTCSFRGYRHLHDLENARQEVFLRAFAEKARLNYDGVRPFIDYLFAIAKNFVISEFRKHTVALEPFDQDAPVYGAENVPGWTPPRPDAAVEGQEVNRLLSQFLAGLGEVERAFHHARFVEQKTQEEAAQALGLTRIKVRRVEKRFRLKLLCFFREHGYLDSQQASRLRLKLKCLLR